MTNPITSALGTQRQFTKQPEAPYQKRLITPSFGGGISMGADNNATLLASSLGLLSSGLMAESIAADKRAEKIGKAEADRIFSVSSEKDKEKLSTLDLLGQSNRFDITDNPYAVARIDELRGQHLNTLFKQEYETEVVPNQALPENSQQNIANFENFMSQKLKDSNITAYNKTAFEKGFYASRPVDVLQQDAQYRKRRQADLEADRDAAIGSKWDDLISDSINMSAEDFAKKAQELQMDAMLTSFPLADRIKLLSEAAKQVASNGNPELLKAWGETIAYHKNDGSEVRVKDTFPLGSYVEMAEKAGVHLYTKKTQDFLASLKDVPSSAIPAKFEEIHAKDPDFWKAIAPSEQRIIAEQERKEKAAAKAALKAQEGAFRQQLVMSALDNRFAVWPRGEYDSTGSLVNSETILVNGKKVTMTPDEINAWGRTKLNQIKTSMPLEEAGKEAMRLMTFPQMHHLITALTAENNYTLSMLNTASLTHDESGALQLPGNLSIMRAMYKTDKGTFRYLFKQQGDELALLDDLIEANGLEEGVSKFALAKDNMRNPDFKAAVEKSAKEKFDFTNNLSVPTLAGNGNTETINFYTNASVQSMLRRNFEANMYCGQTEADALANAQKRTSDYFVSYKGCAFPKAFLYKIPNANQQKTVAMFLEDMMKRENGDRVMYIDNTLQIWRGGVATSAKWNDTKIAEDVTKWLKDLPQEKRVLLDDVYYNPSYDNSNYYLSNPDASTIEEAERQTGIDLSSPVGALVDAVKGWFK